MIKKFLSLTIITFLLTSCDKAHDVKYYLEHPEEMEVKMEECIKNPVKTAEDEDCKNAGIALNKSMFRSTNTKMPQIK